jgi:anthranilate synthase component 2
MILLIDNYDSFVYNLARYVRELGEEPVVRRHDAISVDDILAMGPSHIIISPGPCSPAEAGISTEVVRRAGPSIPILGVCLGHQCIGAAYGGEIVRAGRPMHGKISRIHHGGAGIFSGVPSPFYATRYHSLVIAPASVPPDLEVLATSEDGEVMAVRHVRDPVYGVQFHPESVLTEHGYRLVDHFLHGVPATPRALPAAADGVLVPAMREPSTLASDPPPVDLVR